MLFRMDRGSVALRGSPLQMRTADRSVEGFDRSSSVVKPIGFDDKEAGITTRDLATGDQVLVKFAYSDIRNSSCIVYP